jgi:hypothetical protein
VPNPSLVVWLGAHAVSGRSLKVGAGLGDDAEELARRGLAVTAFDVAPTAIERARRRFPESGVDYVVADAQPRHLGSGIEGGSKPHRFSELARRSILTPSMPELLRS